MLVDGHEDVIPHIRRRLSRRCTPPPPPVIPGENIPIIGGGFCVFFLFLAKDKDSMSRDKRCPPWNQTGPFRFSIGGQSTRPSTDGGPFLFDFGSVMGQILTYRDATSTRGH